jgi:hypothetical protein
MPEGFLALARVCVQQAAVASDPAAAAALRQMARDFEKKAEAQLTQRRVRPADAESPAGRGIPAGPLGETRRSD